MKELFRREPLREFSNYSTSHLHAGEIYQARFRDRPGRAAMWALEQALIRKIFLQLAPRRVLDFATGTGRVVAELQGCLPRCQFDGIDISADMLATARSRCSRVAFHEMDGRQALKEFGHATFDVVSAFRFFANADPQLREDAADQIAALTRDGGHVVINNHRSFWSTSYLAMRATGNRDGVFGSPNSEIKRLFVQRGFTCARTYSLGVWPQTDFRAALLSWPATIALERFNMHYCARLHSLGYNKIFVFRKTAASRP
ncbi:MAG TPA: class I SAM-dependent methyltransferase [Rhodanobacteraceae bacterium]|nr:class I SAM-dependent methyltransferase [Rhodanobacteraceae bacterium]